MDILIIKRKVISQTVLININWLVRQLNGFGKSGNIEVQYVFSPVVGCVALQISQTVLGHNNRTFNDGIFRAFPSILIVANKERTVGVGMNT